MSIINQTVENTLALTQSAEQTKVTLTVSASSALEFVGSASHFKSIIAVIDTLALTHTALAAFVPADVTSILTLTDEVSTNALITTSLIDTLTLTHNVFLVGPVTDSIIDSLTLAQDVDSSIKAGIVSNTLTLSQSVLTAGPILINALTDITNPPDEVDLEGVDPEDIEAIEAAFALVGLRQGVSSVHTLNPVAISYLSLGQEAARVLPQSVSNHLHLSDLAESILDERPVNVLQLTQSVTYDLVNRADSVLEFEQTLISNGVIARGPNNSLILGSITTFYRVDNICDYDPGVGEGPSAPSMVDPVLTRRSTVLLTYPYPQATSTLELRSPQFDDTEQYEFRKINRKSRGGTLKIFRDNAWPSSERLIYSFDNLKDQKKKDLLTFLQTSIGKEIGLLDYESRWWKGVILTPTTQVGEEDSAGNSVTLEFEGIRDFGNLSASLIGSATLTVDLTDIPPGLVASLSGSGSITADIIRD